MNDFDKAQERTNEYKEYLDLFYKKFLFKNMGVVRLDGSSSITLELQRKSVDVIATSPKNGLPTYVEEKDDFHQPKNFCFEVISNTVASPEILGWMATAESDILVYSFIWLDKILDIYVLDFAQLRKWFWSVIYSQKWRKYIVPDQHNHTESRIVPIKQVIAEGIYTSRYLVTLEGCIIPIHPLDNPHDILKFHGLSFVPLAKDDNAA